MEEERKVAEGEEASQSVFDETPYNNASTAGTEDSSASSGSSSDSSVSSASTEDSTAESTASSASTADNSTAESVLGDETIEAVATSGVEIAATQLEENDGEAEDDDGAIYIGDRIQITSRRQGEVVGRIQFIDGTTLVRIMPDGVSDRLYDFPLIDGGFDPDLGITDVVVEKGPRTSFIELQGFRADQTLDVFTANGEPKGSQKIKGINTARDSIQIEGEDGGEMTIDFQGQGPPLDLPFAVFRIAPTLETDKTLTEEELAEEEAQLNLASASGAATIAATAEAFGEEPEFEELGFIDLPVFQPAAEIKASERVYSEITQKSDFLSDLISMVDAPSQRNPLFLKRVRALVETASALKNSILQRNTDGSVIAEEQVSISTIADALKNRKVPLARPILKTKRVLQGPTPDQGPNAPSTEVTEKFVFIPQRDSIISIKTDQDTLSGIPAGEVPSSEEQQNNLRWYEHQRSFFQRNPPGDVYSAGGDSQRFNEDAEQFRWDAPGGDVEGLQEIGDAKEQASAWSDYLTDVPFSLRRGLGPTQRPLKKGGVAISIPGDRAPLTSQALFPYRSVSTGGIGAKRTGRIWEAIVRSKGQIYSMADLIDWLGEPTEDADAQNILLLRSDETTLANIPFTEQIQRVLQSIVPRGPGDLFAMQYDLGTMDREPNVEQLAVIQERILQVLASLKASIRQMRTAEGPPAATASPLSANNSHLQFIQERIQSQPILQDLFKGFQSRIPGYRNVDVAAMGQFLRYAPDYFLAVLGGEMRAVERERIRRVRDQFLDALSAAFIVSQNEKNKGLPPVVNPCAHVKALTQIRKVKSDSEEMALLAKFLAKFQGGREDNWITCSVCHKHLICAHELLQIQKFKHPREQEAIQKEIILKQAGGAFGTNHICRNCGIPIANLEFDTNVEFDDEGRPMMGRSVLVDTDAKEKDEIDFALGPAIGTENEITFETPLKTELQKTMKILSDRIGIQLDSVGIKTLVDRAAVETQKLPSEKRYRKKAEKEKKEGRATLDYAIQINSFKIAIVACLFLIDVQTHMPDYVVRFVLEGCKPGFGGFPIVEDQDPMTSIGLNYIACALTGIDRTEAPWGFTNWHKERSDAKRKATILQQLVQIMQVALRDVNLQQALEQKRAQLRETFGAAAAKGRPSEKLPFAFRPAIETEAERAKNASESPGVAEGATGERGSQLVAAGQIRAGHEMAKRTARIVEGNPFAETSCCFTTLNKPTEFWDNSDMPRLPPKRILKRALGRQSWALTPMVPRQLQTFDIQPNLSLAYRVQLKVCQKGARIGLPHEIGQDNKCDWCEIEIPTGYLYPDQDKDGNPMIDYNEIVQNFERQGVDLSADNFEKVLDASHLRTVFDAQRSPVPTMGEPFLERIAALDPPPCDQWAEALAETQEALKRLEKASTEAEIELALSPLRAAISDQETELQRRVGPQMPVLEEILRERPSDILSILHNQFVVPIRRSIGGVNLAYDLQKNQIDLSSKHYEDLVKMVLNHSNLSSVIFDSSKNVTKAVSKLTQFSDQITAAVQLGEEMRASRLPFGAAFQRAILRVLFLGPLGDLINPAVILEESGEEAAGGEVGYSDRHIIQQLAASLRSQRKERLSQSANLVREKIAKIKEREKQTFIDQFDKMTDEEKAVELQKKKLGIGRWSVGGSKLVYSYDSEYWDKMREERMTNYGAAAGPEGPELPMGFEFGADGIPQFGDQSEREGGQDIDFHPEDAE